MLLLDNASDYITRNVVCFFFKCNECDIAWLQNSIFSVAHSLQNVELIKVLVFKKNRYKHIMMDIRTLCPNTALKCRLLLK